MNWATQMAARMYHLRLSHEERVSAGYADWSACVGLNGVANGISSFARGVPSASGGGAGSWRLGVFAK
jgi:hypothetical protein